MNAKEYIKNAIAFTRITSAISSNGPSQYASRQTQYMARRNKLFYQQRAYLASDFVVAEVQGLKADFYEWSTERIRLSDMTTMNATSFDSKKADDFKEILFENRYIEYFPIGAKLKTMESTWLCINPSNISSVSPNAVIARCNASYNSYDEYGNIITEPIVIQRTNMLSNNSATGENLVLMQGYFEIQCQKNKNTATLGENKRIILGDKAYYITGFTDFVEEFTGEQSSAHVLSFTVRVDEPTQYDDMINRIANGNTRSFYAKITGTSSIAPNGTAQLSAIFFADEEESNLPVSWIWQSSDESVISVDESGLITAHQSGSVEITAVLAQNNAIAASIVVSATPEAQNAHVEFFEPLERSIKQYSSVTVKAAYFANGIQTENPLTWKASGAEHKYYDMTVSEDGLSAVVACNGASNTPLVLTVSYSEFSATMMFTLEGY